MRQYNYSFNLSNSYFFLSSIFLVVLINLLLFNFINFSFSIFIVSLVVLIFFIIILYNPTIGLFLVIISTVLDKLSWEIQGVTIRINQIFILALFTAWLIRFFMGKEKFFRTSIGLPVVLFFLANLASSCLNSPILITSIKRCILISVFLIGYFAVVNILVSRPYLIKKVIISFLIVGVAVSLYSIISIFLYLKGINIGGVQLGQFGTSVTSMGTFMEANILGSYVAVIGIFFFNYLISSYYKKSRGILLIALVLVLITLIISWTRSAWISFSVGIILSFFLSWKERIVSIKGIVILVLVVFISLSLFSFIFIPQLEKISGMEGMFIFKLQRLLDYKSGTGAYRVNVYDLALNHWKKRPFLGWGTDSFKVFGEKSWIPSSIIHVLHDTGIIGLLVYVWMIFRVLFSGLRSLHKNGDIFFKTNMVAFISGFVALTIAYQFASGLWLSFYWIYLGLMMSMVCIHKKIKLGLN